jgi:hypothetical protein
LRSGRRERKYTLTDQQAVAIRRVVRAYLPPDQHMNGDELGYEVYTLYLDSPELALYRRSVEGKKRRQKLRIRFYDQAPDASVFLEVKQRIAKAITKRRAEVAKPTAERLLAGEPILSSELVSHNDRTAQALAEFNQHRHRLAARGVVLISFRREAYMSAIPGSARVTFDRRITVHPYDPTWGLRLTGQGTQVGGACVVMELKHEGKRPDWMRDLTASFGLRRASCPKYVQCLQALERGESRHGQFHLGGNRHGLA